MDLGQIQNQILQELEGELERITVPVEKYVGTILVANGKGIAALVANCNWDLLDSMEQVIGALFVRARLEKAKYDKSVQH